MKKKILIVVLISVFGITGCSNSEGAKVNPSSATYDLYNNKQLQEVEELSEKANGLLSEKTIDNKVYIYKDNDNNILYNYQPDVLISYDGENSDQNNYYFKNSSEIEQNSFYKLISFSYDDDYNSYLEEDVSFYLDDKKLETEEIDVDFNLTNN